MGKVILLARVSSQQQDLSQQTERVLEEIKKDGYTDENIIIIEDKESGVILSEEEIKRVNRIIETSQENIIKEREILDRIYTNYIEMNISKEKADRLSEKHHKIIFEESQKIKEHEEKLVKLNEMLNEKYVIDYKKLNLEEKIDLCKKCINRIELDRGPGQYDLIVEIKFVWRQRNILHIDSYNKRVNSEEEFTVPMLYPPKD